MSLALVETALNVFPGLAVFYEEVSVDLLHPKGTKGEKSQYSRRLVTDEILQGCYPMLPSRSFNQCLRTNMDSSCFLWESSARCFAFLFMTKFRTTPQWLPYMME